MKRFISILLILCLFIPSCLAESVKITDEMLNSLTLEELNDLKTKVDKLISSKKAESSINPDDTGIWQLQFFVDEFQQPTDEGYVANDLVEGTFSNSAATNKKLLARFLIQKYHGKPWVELMLYEYGRSQVKNSGSKTVTYKVTMKDANGKKTNMTASIYSNGDRLTFEQDDAQTIVNALNLNGSISFYIEEVSRYGYNDKYTFTINDTTGFVNAYKQLK